MAAKVAPAKTRVPTDVPHAAQSVMRSGALVGPGAASVRAPGAGLAGSRRRRAGFWACFPFLAAFQVGFRQGHRPERRTAPRKPKCTENTAELPR